MAVVSILLLGDPRLKQVSAEVARDEVASVEGVVRDMHDTMADFQRRHGWGRAIAAPQIGVHKRIVCMNAGEPRTLFNPVLEPLGGTVNLAGSYEEYWEDCMSFPDLMARVRGATSFLLRYRDADWTERRVELTGDFAHLIEHEVDHLNGTLAVDRVITPGALALRDTQPNKDLTMRGAFRPL